MTALQIALYLAVYLALCCGLGFFFALTNGGPK